MFEEKGLKIWTKFIPETQKNGSHVKKPVAYFFLLISLVWECWLMSFECFRLAMAIWIAHLARSTQHIPSSRGNELWSSNWSSSRVSPGPWKELQGRAISKAVNSTLLLPKLMSLINLNNKELHWSKWSYTGEKIVWKQNAYTQKGKPKAVINNCFSDWLSISSVLVSMRTI